MTATVQDLLQFADWTEYKRLQRALKRGQKAAGTVTKRRRRVEAPAGDAPFISERKKMAFENPAAALRLVNVASIASATPDTKPGAWLSVGGVLYDRITDEEAALAAVRAGLKNPTNWGEVRTWAVEGFLRGRRVKGLFRGTEAALRMLWPDTLTRKELQRAGCLEIELMGTGFVVEDRTAEFRHIPDPTHVTTDDLWASRYTSPAVEENAQEAQEGPSPTEVESEAV